MYLALTGLDIIAPLLQTNGHYCKTVSAHISIGVAPGCLIYNTAFSHLQNNTSMKAKLLFSMTIAIISYTTLQAQSADEDAIKKTIRTETESYFKKDTAAWKASFVQDEKIMGTYTGASGYSHYAGWQNFGIPALQWMTKNPSPIVYNELKSDNYIISTYGNVATVQYDQTMTYPGDSVEAYHSHEIRTLVKDGDNWKITSITSVDTSFNSLTAIENRINAAGYGLLSTKRTKDAIDVFKLNTKLFPKSWNVFDSLGEGYMNDGNTAEAIKNYEISIKMNPKNEGGKEMLTKLKKK